MDLDPTTTKYLIKAELNAEGVVEKPDVIGAIFGQTEGLLGDELDLRDLQKSGRIGRIEVTADSKKGRTKGTISMPSSLDKVETAILAAALESIDRVGPCKAEIKIVAIEDVRISKRAQVADRAKQLLQQLAVEGKGESGDLVDDIKSAVRIDDLVSFGPERLPAGPHVSTTDAIIVVEGRNDVANLLKNGIKNAIATEGTSIPKTIVELAKEKVVTAFVDGDRGGELLLKELLQLAEVDFVARAPKTREVEELTQKAIMKSLRNKLPAEQFLSEFGIEASTPEGSLSASKREARKEMRAELRHPRSRDEDDEDERPRMREERREAPRDEPREERRGGQREDRRPERGPERRDERRGADRPREEHRGHREERPRFERREEQRRPERTERREAPREERREMPREERREMPREERREAPREAPREAVPEAFEERAPPPSARAGPMGEYRTFLDDLAGKLQAVFLDDKGTVVKGPIAVRELADTLKREGEGVRAVVFDGVVTQRLLDIAVDKKVKTLVGVKMGNITKQPTEVEVFTRADL